MRTIKFRAWDGERMRYMGDSDFILCYAGVYQEGELGGGKVVEWPLMQSTGLVDKNGNEIFEGDLLLVEDEYTDRFLDDGTGPTEPCNHIAAVEFADGAFGVNILDSAIYARGFHSFSSIRDNIGDEPKDMEIIGNIYENPELLKTK